MIDTRQPLPPSLYPAPQTPTGREWLRLIPGLLVSIIALGIVFFVTDFQKLIAALRQADYRLVALCVGISLGWVLVRSAAWRTLMRKLPHYKDVFFAVNEGYLLNNLLPFRLGELGRAFLLGRKPDRTGQLNGFWRVFPTILIERALDMIFAVAVLAISLPFAIGNLQGSGVDHRWSDLAAPTAAFLGALMILAFFALYLLAHNRHRAIQALDQLGLRCTQRRLLVPKAVFSFGGKTLPAFISGLEVLTNGKLFLAAMGWFILNWGLAVLQYLVLMAAFFPEARSLANSLHWAGFALGVSALGLAAPSSPGNVGVLEGAIVAALSILGLDPSAALAFAITIHMIQVVVTTGVGVFALSQEGETLLGLYRQLRSQQHP